METLTLKLRGMSCASCAKNIEQAVQSVPGVIDCNVNFAVEQATVKYNPQQTNLEKIQQAVTDAGYAAFSLQEQERMTGEDDAEKAGRLAEQRELTLKVWIGGAIGVLLVVGTLPAMTGLAFPLIPGWLNNSWVQLVLATPVQFWCGQSFYQNGWKALKRHAATMDTLIALGTSAAYFYSVFATVFPEFFEAQHLAAHTYYETAVIVTTLILLGRLFENRARGQTSEAIRQLIGLQARTARVIRNGQEVDVPLQEVEVDDVVLVRVPAKKSQWMGK